MSNTPPTTTKRNTTIVLSKAVHEQVSKMALKEKRSVSSQIEYLLERALVKPSTR